MTPDEIREQSTVHQIVRQHRVLVVQKSCDECGHDSVVVTLPIDRGPQEMKTGDDCHCPECELMGVVVLHGATPSSDDVEETFDIQWIDPETGGDYRH